MACCPWCVFCAAILDVIALTRCLVVDFFNHLNMLYGTITEFCTPNEVRPIFQLKLSSQLELLFHSARSCLLVLGVS